MRSPVRARLSARTICCPAQAPRTSCVANSNSAQRPMPRRSGREPSLGDPACECGPGPESFVTRSTPDHSTATLSSQAVPRRRPWDLLVLVSAHDASPKSVRRTCLAHCSCAIAFVPAHWRVLTITVCSHALRGARTLADPARSRVGAGRSAQRRSRTALPRSNQRCAAVTPGTYSRSSSHATPSPMSA